MPTPRPAVLTIMLLTTPLLAAPPEPATKPAADAQAAEYLDKAASLPPKTAGPEDAVAHAAALQSMVHAYLYLHDFHLAKQAASQIETPFVQAMELVNIATAQNAAGDRDAARKLLPLITGSLDHPAAADAPAQNPATDWARLAIAQRAAGDPVAYQASADKALELLTQSAAGINRAYAAWSVASTLGLGGTAKDAALAIQTALNNPAADLDQLAWASHTAHALALGQGSDADYAWIEKLPSPSYRAAAYAAVAEAFLQPPPHPFSLPYP